MTTSAYVKVVAGQFFMGQEANWKPLTNSAWQRVAVTDPNPTRTLGGAYGFAGQASVYTEAYVALPKVELGEPTPYVTAAQDTVPTAVQLFSAVAGGLGSGRTTSPFTTAGGTLMVFASGSGWDPNGGAYIGMEVFLDAASIGFAKAFTNELGSHKAFPATTLVVRGIAAGVHTITLKPWNGTRTDAADFFNVAVMEVP